MSQIMCYVLLMCRHELKRAEYITKLPKGKHSTKGITVLQTVLRDCWHAVIIIIIDNRGLNTRWCLTPLLLSLPTAAYLGQRGLTPAGLPHTTAQCHLTILSEAVLFCLNHPSFRTPRSLSFCCRSFCRYGRRGATFSVSLSAVGFLSIESFCTILH